MGWNLRIILLAILLFLPLSIVTSYDVQAKEAVKKTTHHKTSSHKTKKKAAVKKHSAKKEAAAQQSRFSALVVNGDTGRIIYEKNAGGIRYPASLTKMMTLYLTFDALKKGKLKMSDTLPVSAKAAGQPQTNISLTAGERLPVKTAIESLIVRSANDSAMVIAEALGGTSWNFALLMTQKARALGMKDTIFRNPNGLPDNQQYTTAYDMAKLGIALRRDFPEYYPLFKLKSFTYDGITYPGHNHVMARYPGVDGIKTGYIRASGFNLVTSVKKDGYNLVAVIMGGTSVSARDNAMCSMLDKTFAQLETQKKTYAENQKIISPASAVKAETLVNPSKAANIMPHSF
jgi:D-alanyl-D-alanine carboxypeptidase